MNLSVIRFGYPPKSGTHGFDFPVNGGRDSKVRNNISVYGLNNRLEKVFTTSIREEFIFSAIDFFSYSVSKVSKLDYLTMRSESREAMIEVVTLADMYVKTFFW